MIKLEDRIRSGLHQTAERIPETRPGVAASTTRSRRPAGVWMGVAAIFVVLTLFSPLLFLSGSSSTSAPAESAASGEPEVDTDITRTADGFEFTNPEHVRLRFTQDLTLTCQDLETVDNGGFDSFDMDIWIDHTEGYARFGIDYPNGSSHDLIFQGQPGAWERAWGTGTDLGRSAGCRQYLEDGGHNTSVAGWAHQDASDLWFTAYLTPVAGGEDGAVVSHEGQPERATSIGPRTYLSENVYEGGTHHRYEYTLEESGRRVMGEERYLLVPDQFQANATIEVLESGPAELPPDVFDTSTFTPLWGGDPVPTTEGTTP